MKKTEKKFDKKINIKEIRNRYAPNLDAIFFKEDEAEIVKLIIEEKLDVVDRNIFLIYIENGFDVKYLSKFFGCSDSLVYNKLNKIKEKIRKEFENFRKICI